MSEKEKPGPRSELAAKQRKTPDERLQEDPSSTRLAIAAFCYECQGGGADGTFITKGRVRDCPSSKTCRLWGARPWQNTTTQKDF